MFTDFNDTDTVGASISGGIHDDNDKKSLAHGIVMVLVAVFIAPVDILAASVLRRWPAVYIFTSTIYVIGFMGGFGLGIKVSAVYLAVGYMFHSILSLDASSPLGVKARTDV